MNISSIYCTIFSLVLFFRPGLGSCDTGSTDTNINANLAKLNINNSNNAASGGRTKKEIILEDSEAETDDDGKPPARAAGHAVSSNTVEVPLDSGPESGPSPSHAVARKPIVINVSDTEAESEAESEIEVTTGARANAQVRSQAQGGSGHGVRRQPIVIGIEDTEPESEHEDSRSAVSVKAALKAQAQTSAQPSAQTGSGHGVRRKPIVISVDDSQESGAEQSASGSHQVKNKPIQIGISDSGTEDDVSISKVPGHSVAKETVEVEIDITPEELSALQKLQARQIEDAKETGRMKPIKIVSGSESVDGSVKGAPKAQQKAPTAGQNKNYEDVPLSASDLESESEEDKQTRGGKAKVVDIPLSGSDLEAPSSGSKHSDSDVEVVVSRGARPAQKKAESDVEVVVSGRNRQVTRPQQSPKARQGSFSTGSGDFEDFVIDDSAGRNRQKSQGGIPISDSDVDVVVSRGGRRANQLNYPDTDNGEYEEIVIDSDNGRGDSSRSRTRDFASGSESDVNVVVSRPGQKAKPGHDQRSVNAASALGGSASRSTSTPRGRVEEFEVSNGSRAGYEDIRLSSSDADVVVPAKRKPDAAGAGKAMSFEDDGSSGAAASAPKPTSGYVKPLMLVVDISKKWSTPEIKYSRDEAKAADVFFALDPHLIYKVTNFDHVLWHAVGDNFCKKVDVRMRPNQEPLVNVYFPRRFDTKPPTIRNYKQVETQTESEVQVQEVPLSDYGRHTKFVVNEARMSDKSSAESDFVVEEVRLGGYDSDIRLRDPKRRPVHSDASDISVQEVRARRKGPLPMVHLVSLDIRNTRTTNMVIYEREGELDVFTPVPPYLFDKVTKRDRVVWVAENGKYANKVVQSRNGVRRNFRVFFPTEVADCTDSGSDADFARARPHSYPYFHPGQPIPQNFYFPQPLRRHAHYASSPMHPQGVPVPAGHNCLHPVLPQSVKPGASFPGHVGSVPPGPVPRAGPVPVHPMPAGPVPVVHPMPAGPVPVVHPMPAAPQPAVHSETVRLTKPVAQPQNAETINLSRPVHPRTTLPTDSESDHSRGAYTAYAGTHPQHAPHVYVPHPAPAGHPHMAQPAYMSQPVRAPFAPHARVGHPQHYFHPTQNAHPARPEFKRPDGHFAFKSQPKRHYRKDLRAPYGHDHFTQSHPENQFYAPQFARPQPYMPQQPVYRPEAGAPADPQVEILELYKVEESETDEETEPQTPDFNKHIVVDVKKKQSTDEVIYEFNALENAEIFTARDPYLIGVIKKNNKIVWTSKDGRFSKKIILRARKDDISLLRVFVPRFKPPSSYGKLTPPSLPLKVELDLNYNFSTNEYDCLCFNDAKSQDKSKVVYTTKNGYKFNVVRRDQTVIWRASSEAECSHQVLVIKYRLMSTEQVVVYLPDGSTKKFTRQPECLNYFTSWADGYTLPTAMPPRVPTELDLNVRKDTTFYLYSFYDNVETYTALNGFVFSAVKIGDYRIWVSDGNEFSMKVEVINGAEIYVQLCSLIRRFRKGQGVYDAWFEV